jgi:uncharacterized protein YcfJ
MKSILIPVAFALAVTMGAAPSVQAAGCLRGAIVGGTVGHLAGHHGWLGAGAGCVIGSHEANKREREEMSRNAREDSRQEREFGGSGRW